MIMSLCSRVPKYLIFFRMFVNEFDLAWYVS